jgi:aerobic-type carbon monoxide dehydrogenase small subunit (CoxS/CutS family)
MTTLPAHEEITITFRLNGKAVSARCTPRMHLADFLRHRCHKTGTHVGCEHGVCGACTVLVNGRAVRSCLLYAVQVESEDVQTVEHLAHGTQLSDLQEEFRRNFAVQCGFCTPGILMSAVDFLAATPAPTEEQVRELLSGHLCRCTGYHGIVKAILATAASRAKTKNET